jgi:hypothetical protein
MGGPEAGASSGETKITTRMSDDIIVSLADVNNDSWLETPEFLLALLVWLILLSLLFLALFIVLLCRRKKDDKIDYLRHYDARPISAYSNFANNNFGTNMKADETLNYFNPSIGIRGSPRVNGERDRGSMDCVRET